jgi:hypothetical protein
MNQPPTPSNNLPQWSGGQTQPQNQAVSALLQQLLQNLSSQQQHQQQFVNQNSTFRPNQQHQHQQPHYSSAVNTAVQNQASQTPIRSVAVPPQHQFGNGSSQAVGNNMGQQAAMVSLLFVNLFLGLRTCCASPAN